MDKKIVFDLGGVLLDWNPRHLYRKVFVDQKELNYFLAEICSPEWNAQMDAGKPFREAIAELVRQHPRYAEQIQIYFSRWEEMMGGSIPETVRILEELKQGGCQLAALSNWSRETFPLVQGRYDFLDWFDPLLISGRLGVAKPAPEIYRILLQVTGWGAEDCLFIDDVLENVQEASRQGFEAIHFQTPANLRKELAERGLLQAG